MSDGREVSGARTEGKVVWRKGLCAAQSLSTIIAERDDVCLYAHPSEIAFECTRDVGLSAGRESDGEDENLACMPEQTRGRRVQGCRHSHLDVSVRRI